MCKSIRVLIVDDHPIIRSGIKEILEQDTHITVVGEASNCQDAIEFTRNLMPQVILLDLDLPDKNGIVAIKSINKEHTGIQIIVLSNYSDEKLIVEAIEAGAIGYLLKVDATDKIIAAVKDAFDGIPTLSMTAGRSLMTYLRSSSRPMQEKPEMNLTKKEIQVLRLLAEGLIAEGIAKRMQTSTGTIRSHVSHILRKLRVNSRAQAVVYAVKNGLVDPENRDIEHV